ncbi:LOW QUALITY PROTEIN: hypothetical protein HJFPF1_13199 [Paramyrothecium foliicola]|nr:LOW QUALITY PROTEIN: hypothetical protein HJFPF1_13199 [Paramyrothecium foliicola]
MADYKRSATLASANGLPQKLRDLDHADSDLVRLAGRQDTSAHDEEEVRVLLHDAQGTGVGALLGDVVGDPGIRVAQLAVDVDVLEVAADDDAAVLAADGGPDDEGAVVGQDVGVGGVDVELGRVGELAGVLGDAVVDGEAVGGRDGGATVLVDVDVVASRQLGDHGHAGTLEVVVGVGNVGDGLAPVDEILGGLVAERLTGGLVALVGKVQDQIILVHPNIQLDSSMDRSCLAKDPIDLQDLRLPNRSLLIVGNCTTALDNTGNELPGTALVGRSIDIDLGLAQVGRDGVTGAQDGSGLVLADLLAQLIQERLVTHAPAVLGVMDLAYLFP